VLRIDNSFSRSRSSKFRFASSDPIYFPDSSLSDHQSTTRPLYISLRWIRQWPISLSLKIMVLCMTKTSMNGDSASSHCIISFQAGFRSEPVCVQVVHDYNPYIILQYGLIVPILATLTSSRASMILMLKVYALLGSVEHIFCNVIQTFEIDRLEFITPFTPFFCHYDLRYIVKKLCINLGSIDDRSHRDFVELRLVWRRCERSGRCLVRVLPLL
jgi:hypothetical protein